MIPKKFNTMSCFTNKSVEIEDNKTEIESIETTLFFKEPIILYQNTLKHEIGLFHGGDNGTQKSTACKVTILRVKFYYSSIVVR